MLTESGLIEKVNQNAMTIRLRDKMNAADGWGHEEGHRVHDALLLEVNAHSQVVVFRISLDGVRRTDASFPRESVCELARRFRGEKGFCITDVEDVDLLENWDAAARRTEQPLNVWLKNGEHKLLGIRASQGTARLFEMVVEADGLTAGEIAQRMEQGLSNISNKLKSLWSDGYIMRRERSAASGGIEFEYFVAK